MARYGVLLAVVMAVAWSQLARGDDPPAGSLNTAKAAHRTALDKARQQLLAQFDAAIQVVAKSGDLDAVRAIREEKNDFETDARRPTASRMRSAVNEYQLAVRQASTNLAKAYEEAIREATKALNIERAEQLDKDLKELKATIVDKPKPAAGNRPNTSGFQYSFFEWQKDDPPLKMIHSNEGFCYLAGIHGALVGGGESVRIVIGKDGFWWVDGASATDQPLTVRVVAVKVPRKGA